MDRIESFEVAASVGDWCEVNSSFDKGRMLIAYPGENRNKTSISKEVFEQCLETLWNVPVVTHYIRETDSLGGHDVALVEGQDGNFKMVNETDPVGVIPESAVFSWQTVTEADGTVNDYLCTDVLLWKRQEAYDKIKNDGITAQSMEILIKAMHMEDGIYHIDDFEFQALCLIGVEPCFESASLEMYSADTFQSKFSDMMKDLKETIKTLNAPAGAEDTTKFSKEGGSEAVNEKELLAAEFGIDTSALDFALEDFSLEELREKFEAMKNAEAAEPEAEPEAEASEPEAEAVEPEAEPEAEAGAEPEAESEIEAEPEAEAQPEGEFALNTNVREALREALSGFQVMKPWGMESRFYLIDFDAELSEVYAEDGSDHWHLVGMPYSISGDKAVVDATTPVRKKYAIVDYDGGDQATAASIMFEKLEEFFNDKSEAEKNYSSVKEENDEMAKELASLREFKAGIEKEEHDAVVAEMFSRFEDLKGIEAFEALKESDLDLESIEEKCYAIRGRQMSEAKFSVKNFTPKIKVTRTEDKPNAPYGGIVEEYKNK